MNPYDVIQNCYDGYDNVQLNKNYDTLISQCKACYDRAVKNNNAKADKK